MPEQEIRIVRTSVVGNWENNAIRSITFLQKKPRVVDNEGLHLSELQMTQPLLFRAQEEIKAVCCDGNYTTVVCPNSIVILDDNMEVVQRYVNHCSADSFTSCTFAQPTGSQVAWLLLGTAGGMIYVHRCEDGSPAFQLEGHGGQITQMQIHPQYPQLLLSCSYDESIRLWNLQTRVCVAIFSGLQGHRDRILALAVHPNGEYFISCGSDNHAKIWALWQPEILDALKRSHSFHHETSGRQFGTIQVHHPNFSSHLIHRHYIHCACYYGDMVLTQSHDEILLWMPAPLQPKLATAVSVMQIFRLPASLKHAGVDPTAFLTHRFAVDPTGKYLVAGGHTGRLAVWSLVAGDELEPAPLCEVQLPCTKPNLPAAVRCIRFRENGSMVMSVREYELGVEEGATHDYVLLYKVSNEESLPTALTSAPS